MANDLTPWKMVLHTTNLQPSPKDYKPLITKVKSSANTLRRHKLTWHDWRFGVRVAQRTSVLLVDDDSTVRQSLEQALLLENFRVVAAANGQEALRGFGENRIDIVLLDLNLGRESGWDTLRQLRQIQPLLPVIIMTGNPGQRAPRSTPVDAFMEKPLDLPILFRKLTELGSSSAAKPSGDAEN